MSNTEPALLKAALGAIRDGRSPTFAFGDKRYFGKICPSNLLERELNGYRSCASFYPVPVLSGFFRDNQEGYLIYEYEETVGENMGLLVDVFSGSSPSDPAFGKVLEMYADAFRKSLYQDIGRAADIFFKDRIATRLRGFYDDAFLDRTSNFEFNGQELAVRLRPIVEQISSFFSTDRVTWCVISQCDPNDLNIGIKPILFDFTAGGYVPIWAEFATLFWYQLAQGSHLSPRYNKQHFEHHSAIFQKLDAVEFDGRRLKHSPQALRRSFVEGYIEKVLTPLWDQIGEDESWYEQFRNYIAMKILCVFNLTSMSDEDRLLSISYLELIYNRQAPKHPRDLLALFA